MLVVSVACEHVCSHDLIWGRWGMGEVGNGAAMKLVVNMIMGRSVL